jgi:hypothetical protein
MRAHVTEFKTFAPTQVLRGVGGDTMVVTRGVQMHLTVVANPEPGETARMMGAEVIVAPIPVRRTDGVTEGTMAVWADLIAHGYEGAALALAASLLLPEVTALRYKVESLEREVKWLREREARPYLDKLKEVAAGLRMEVEVADGVFTMKPIPEEDDPDAGDW